MEDIKRMLDDEYVRTLEAVSLAKAGSDEGAEQLKKLAELHRQRMEEVKAAESLRIQQEELELKKTQAQEAKKDRIIKIVVDGVSILLPVAVSSYWMAKGLQFEKTGSFTSRTGTWLSNHLRLFKK